MRNQGNLNMLLKTLGSWRQRTPQVRLSTSHISRGKCHILFIFSFSSVKSHVHRCNNKSILFFCTFSLSITSSSDVEPCAASLLLIFHKQTTKQPQLGRAFAKISSNSFDSFEKPYGIKQSTCKETSFDLIFCRYLSWN